MHRPWASLLSRLRNPELEMSPLDDKVIRQKMRRYGSDNKVDILHLVYEFMALAALNYHQITACSSAD